MATTTTPRRPRTTPRDRGSDHAVNGGERGAAGRVRASRVGYDEQYDLLTAALIGVAIGIGTTLLVRRGPSGRRPLSPLMSGAAQGAKWAGGGAARLGKRGASWAREAGEELWDRIPREEIRDQVRDYVSRAHEAIDDTVQSELRDLRRVLKRQRKRLGI